MTNFRLSTPLLKREIWETQLGMLAIPLYEDKESSERSVLLNGNRGNFCLDTRTETFPYENRNAAWSADVSYYITIDNKGWLHVDSWNRSGPQTYDLQRIENDLIGFHRMLERSDPKGLQDIVNHVIRVFRSLRAQFSNVSGMAALNAFLYLLGSSSEHSNRQEFEYWKWGLDENAKEIVKKLTEVAWYRLVDELTGQDPITGLRPDLELVLRHASGRIFQEAHYEALQLEERQPDFFGFFNEPLRLSKTISGIGLHFTPPSLARTLVEEALAAYGDLEAASLTILDPACGSGEFLREMLRQLDLRRYTGRITLVGWDVSRAACAMARFVLAFETRQYEERIRVVIENRDSLAHDTKWNIEPDIVIMNPPFVSTQNMSPEQKNRVDEILGPTRQTRPDLSSAFVWMAAENLPNRGVLASIIPASFLDSESNRELRERLRDRLSTTLVARLGSHMLFSSALIDAGLYVGKSSSNTGSPIAFWADHRSSSNAEGLRALRKVRLTQKQLLPIVQDGFSIYSAPEYSESGKTWAPRPYASRSLLLSVENKMPTRVRDIFDVKLGVRTGEKKAFVLPKAKWRALPKTERKYFRPAVVNRSIKFGYLLEDDYIFYPYGPLKLDSEDEVKQKLPTYYDEILTKFKPSILRRSRRNEENWWQLRDPGTWQFETEPKIVSTSFGDSDSFAWDQKGDFVVVQGHGWVSKVSEKPIGNE